MISDFRFQISGLPGQCRWIIVAAAMLLSTSLGFAQSAPPAATSNTSLDLTNPVSILQNAGNVIPGLSPMPGVPGVPAVPGVPGGLPGSPPNDAAIPGGVLPGTPTGTTASPAPSSSPIGGNAGMSTGLSILVLLTVLTIAPSLLILTTSFTRIVIVLSLLKQAIGTQSLPPSQVIVGLSLFLTFLVMAPTFDRINREAIVPLQNNQIDQLTAWSRAKQPLRDFMFDQLEHARNWDDLYLILNYRGIDTSHPEKLARSDVDMLSLIPAFILSELKVAFLMGFRLYLPFLIIDMVVSSVLMSMGMLMLPPVLISLPFKLLMFVLADGWRLVTGNLLHSFAVPGVTT